MRSLAEWGASFGFLGGPDLDDEAGNGYSKNRRDLEAVDNGELVISKGGIR